MVQDQQQQRDNPHAHDVRLFLSTRKLFVVLFMGGLSLCLGATVVTLQMYILRQKQHLRQIKRQQQRKESHISKTGASTVEIAAQDDTRDDLSLDLSHHSRSLQPASETRKESLRLWTQQQKQPYSQTISGSGQAYWNQILPLFQQWDAALMDENTKNNEDSTTLRLLLDAATSTTSTEQQQDLLWHLWYSFEEAAYMGHPEAMFRVANWMASGIPPMPYPDDATYSVKLRILDTFHYNNLVDSYLMYHMAAMNGHVESALAMGYRQVYHEGQNTQDRLDAETCARALPYYEAAAHGIVDELEADMHSRAKITPPMDGHVLSELHAQGTHTQTGSTWYNAPDEPAEALQYYHMRSTQQDDIGAAYTLGQYYHHGIRGVAQNMTKALYYYELAANLGHWESAGQAGKFYVWGLGMEWQDRNFYKAHKLFTKGAPLGVDGCRQRFRQRKSQKDIKVCDHPSLNGLGLLHLLGVPMVVAIDIEKAKQYFTLARDMGNPDASYNLAMMRLGWKTFWHELQDLHVANDAGGAGQQNKAAPEFLDNGKVYTPEQAGPNKGDYLIAVQDLVTASSKGHLQAKHRLGMLYSRGVNVTLSDGKSLVAIAQDCNKALKHFTWLAETANPYLSKRLRRAYQQYMAGDYDSSLKNYAVAAETGNELAQINAAFLLEQGVCLGLEPTDCAGASLRLWKGAVGINPEACLHVGDIYFYGRLREWAFVFSPGPFRWLPLVLYPEKNVWPYLQILRLRISKWLAKRRGEVEEEQTCDPDYVATDGTCLQDIDIIDPAVVPRDVRDSDLRVAAKYYQMAANTHKSPRGNFNLGFMHEWGLGLKQDFPLAKRHYDLAASLKPGEGDLAVQIAIMAMRIHERVVKLHVAWKDFWYGSNQDIGSVGGSAEDAVPKAGKAAVGQPLPSPTDSSSKRPRTKTDVIISHLFSWETLWIVVLTFVLTKLFQYRRTHR